jgi:hypothetical protein
MITPMPYKNQCATRPPCLCLDYLSDRSVGQEGMLPAGPVRGLRLTNEDHTGGDHRSSGRFEVIDFEADDRTSGEEIMELLVGVIDLR